MLAEDARTASTGRFIRMREDCLTMKYVAVYV